MEREPSASAAASAAAAAFFSWGANSYGQLGLGHKEDVLLPQQLSDFCKPECIRRITGGGGHSAVVTDGGGLFVCGLNKDGQLGLGHTEDVLYFTACRSLLGCPILQVACGWDFTIILTESGQVLSCGSNCFGQLGVPHGPRRCVVPQAIELLREKVVCIAAGLRHALAATANGIVFQWGTGLASSGRRLCPGQTLPPFLTAREPSRVTGLENSKVTCVLAGSDHSASLTDAGELYVWGSNKHGQLASLAAFLPMPQKIEAHCFQNEKVTSVWSGWTHLVAQTETGKVFTWGRADYGQLGRKLASPEDWKLQSQDPSYPHSGPRKSMPSPLHCLTGATEEGRVTLGAGTSTACAGMALKTTSGPRSLFRLCARHWDSSWAVGLATPWPSATCQFFLSWANTPRSLALPQMPLRMLNLRKPWTKREIGRKGNQKLLPKANMAGPEMGGL
ncbi:secretion-regulating guanine nucleotide exchange factor isoform X2 [Mustela lutreola]|uniref:secretion-regulating guanine nucleotide exchange factor isoform X2 n=1 Tax=Mustela lutreola TaxID=9666 RepID=UPI0027974381|nr:secretion-regulating guanine nucleotide exchange factor isoform X2 [Mustela lutreola]